MYRAHDVLEDWRTHINILRHKWENVIASMCIYIYCICINIYTRVDESGMAVWSECIQCTGCRGGAPVSVVKVGDVSEPPLTVCSLSQWRWDAGASSSSHDAESWWKRSWSRWRGFWQSCPVTPGVVAGMEDTVSRSDRVLKGRMWLFSRGWELLTSCKSRRGVSGWATGSL